MSDVKIRAALEKRLQAMTSALAIAFENTAFDPQPDTPYQRVDLMRAQPENPTFDGFKRKLGIFQVMLLYPQNAGPGAAEAQAQAIADWFPRRLTLTESGVDVTIDKDAYIMAGFPDGDRWAVPVRVSYFSNITS